MTSNFDGLPNTFDREDLERAGYVGWSTWDQLRQTEFVEIPKATGCYVVFRPSTVVPRFRAKSPAGRFKGKDPTVSAQRMGNEWVPNAHVVYIGKADDLRTRLRAYARFGAGDPVAHWGGRLIWQLQDADSLLVAWRALAEAGTARQLEQRLLARFVDLHERRPMANLTS